MQEMRSNFLKDDSGAVTIDWVVVLSGLLMLAFAVTGGIVSAVKLGGEDIGSTTGEFDFRSAAGFVEAPPSSSNGGGGHGGSQPPSGGAGDFVPGNGNGGGNPCGGPGQSCSGLGDGTNPGQGSGNNNAGDTPGGTGTNNPGGGNQDSGGENDAGNGNGNGNAGGNGNGNGNAGGNGNGNAGGNGNGNAGGNGNGNGNAGGNGNGNAGGNGNTPPVNADFVIPPQTLATAGWSDTVVSDWLSLPGDIPVNGPVGFTLSGYEGATLQTLNGRAASGQIPSWGTNIHIPTPSCGSTATVVIELANGLVGIWEVTRPAWPANEGTPPAGC